METAKREMTFLLAARERQLLYAIARRVPHYLRSNHFSGVGVIGAVGTGAAYALSTFGEGWLWLASLMLVVNWLGDSLDGTLARVRAAERPKYGYYIDHIIDAFSTAVVGVGIGLSPYVTLEIALVLVVIYLMLSINVYLESSVFGVFRMAYGKIGPTEGRLILVVANTLLAVGSTLPQTGNVTLGVYTNGTVLFLGAALFATLSVRFGKNLHRLARMEPQRNVQRG